MMIVVVVVVAMVVVVVVMLSVVTVTTAAPVAPAGGRVRCPAGSLGGSRPGGTYGGVDGCRGWWWEVAGGGGRFRTAAPTQATPSEVGVKWE